MFSSPHRDDPSHASISGYTIDDFDVAVELKALSQSKRRPFGPRRERRASRAAAFTYRFGSRLIGPAFSTLPGACTTRIRMKLHIDKEADALYLRLDDSAIVESEEVAPGVVPRLQRGQPGRRHRDALALI